MAKEQNGNFEAQLFKAADKLRKNIDAAEYKNVALGLIFLKYISESFQELYDKLAQDEFSDPEDRDEYKAENIFFVPEQARWKNLQAKAKLPTIGQELDDAMESIEKENPELRNVLPKVFGKPNLDKTSLGQLIDLISNTELKATSENSKDLFGRVYEYFLGEFANAEGKKGGQFYTPKSIVKLMVEMIEPYKGRVYDPACGSGGMFVMSEKFVSEHQGNIKDITIYGQESNQTTWKLSKMNLAIRNINSQFVSWNTEGSFLKDAHPDQYEDTKGFCKSAQRDEVEKHGFVLTPGRYVGITDAIDDGIPFEEKMEKLTITLAEQFAKEEVMNAEIKKQLAKIGFSI